MLSHEEESAVRQMLQAASRTAASGTPAHIEQRLLKAVRRRRAIRGTRFALAGAVAAATVAGIWFQAAPPAERPAETAVVVPARPPALPVPPADNAPEPAVKRKRTNRPARTTTVAAPEAGFIPVGGWQAMEPMERGSIVRVRLPLSAMQGLGIPVSAERWNESIPAEVVLGEDGTMRAVRIVNARQ
jgi:hypothetical protein